MLSLIVREIFTLAEVICKIIEFMDSTSSYKVMTWMGIGGRYLTNIVPIKCKLWKIFLHRHILLAVWNADGAGFDSVGDVCSFHLSDLFLTQERIQTLQGIYTYMHGIILLSYIRSVATETCKPKPTELSCLEKMYGALVQFGYYQHRYEWKGRCLWCSNTVRLLSA